MENPEFPIQKWGLKRLEGYEQDSSLLQPNAYVHMELNAIYRGFPGHLNNNFNLKSVESVTQGLFSIDKHGNPFLSQIYTIPILHMVSNLVHFFHA